MEKFCIVEDLKYRSSLKMTEKYKKYFRKDIYIYIYIYIYNRVWYPHGIAIYSDCSYLNVMWIIT